MISPTTIAAVLSFASAPALAASAPRVSAETQLDCPMAGELSEVVPLPDGGLIDTCVLAEDKGYSDARRLTLVVERRAQDLTLKWTATLPLALDAKLANTMRAERVPWHALRLTDDTLTVLTHDGLTLSATPLNLDGGQIGTTRPLLQVSLAGTQPGLLPLLPVNEPERAQTLSGWSLADRPRHLLGHAAVALSPSGAWVAVASVERDGSLTLRLFGGAGLEPVGNATLPRLGARRGTLFVSDEGTILAALARAETTGLELVSLPRKGEPTVAALDPGVALQGAPLAVWSQGAAWVAAELPGQGGAPATLWVARQDPATLSWRAPVLVPLPAELRGQDRIVLAARPEGGVVAGAEGLQIQSQMVYVPSASGFGGGYAQQVLQLHHGPIALVALGSDGATLGRLVLEGPNLVTGMTSVRSAWAWSDQDQLQILWWDGGISAQQVGLADGAAGAPQRVPLGLPWARRGLWLTVTPGLSGDAWLIVSPAAFNDRAIRRAQEQTILAHVELQ